VSQSRARYRERLRRYVPPSSVGAGAGERQGEAASASAAEAETEADFPWSTSYVGRRLHCSPSEALAAASSLRALRVALQSHGVSSTRALQAVVVPVRQRRRRAEIERPFHCSAAHCRRSYASEGSLKKHVVAKHPELTYVPSHLRHRK